ncbi:MAG TPA: hypothetical protein VFL91_12455 [Thermomicrobiales bacterium]|nr:hypothetical protein [Thermomicrobiales bacterium]
MRLALTRMRAPVARAGGVARAALAVLAPALALGGAAATLAFLPPGRETWALFACCLALPLLAPLRRGYLRLGRVSVTSERLLGAEVAVGVALTVAMALLPAAALAPWPVARLALLVALVALTLALALPARAANAALLAALALLAAAAMTYPYPVAAALDRTLGSAFPWVLVGSALAGVVALRVLGWSAGGCPSRRLTVPLYAAVGLGLAAWWQWGGPTAEIAALAGLSEVERQAAALVPLILAIGVAAEIGLALALPALPWHRAARADLAACLAFGAVPLAAPVLAARRTLAIEGVAALSWLAGLILVGVALRALVGARLLLSAAADERTGERRLALALLVLCLAVFWPAAAWRAADMRPRWDEPQYLAATMNLWHDHDLELTTSMFSAEMDRLLGDRPGDRPVHIYEDDKTDRMSFSAPATPRTSLYVPLAAGPDLRGAIQLANTGPEPAGTTVTFRDAAGREVATRDVTVPPGRALTVAAPSAGNGWLNATVAAGKPVAATTLLTSDAGDELVAGGVAIPRSCIPYGFPTGVWETSLVVQNPLESPAAVTWRRYTADGADAGSASLTVPARGAAVAPLALGAATGTVCVNGDGPILAELLARGKPGLLVQPGASAQQAPVAIPLPLEITNQLGLRGTGTVRLYNPGADPVRVAVYDDANLAAPRATVAIPPQGTREFSAERFNMQPGHNTGWLSPSTPVMAAVVSGAGGHVAALAPRAADTTLAIPVLSDAARRENAAHLEVTNGGATDAMATARLADATGATLWQDKFWVPAHSVVDYPFWYQGPLDGTLTVSALAPLSATLLQRAVVTAWPFHSIGLSVEVLPGYALGGWPGVLAELGLVAALLAVALYGLLRDVGVGRRAALVVTLLVACAAPVSSYAVQLYPEVTAALLLVVAVRLLGDPARTPWRIAGGIACAVGVALLHTRFLPLTLLLLAWFAALLLWQRGAAAGLGTALRRRWPWLVGLVAAAALLTALLWSLEQRARLAFVERYLVPATAGSHLLGILFDGGGGLLPCLPLLLLAGSGFVWAIRRAPALGSIGVALVAVQFALVALRGGGWEAGDFPGRYILPAVPFLAVALGAAWQRGFARPVRPLVALLGAWGLAVGAFYLWDPGGTSYVLAPRSWSADAILTTFVGWNPLSVFPVLPSNAPDVGHPVTAPLVAALAAVVLAGLLLGARWSRPTLPRLFRPPWRREAAAEPVEEVAK